MHSIGSMFQIFFSVNPIFDYVSAKTSDTNMFSLYFRELLKQGVFVPPSQFETCFMSTAHSTNDLDCTVEAIDIALQKVSTEGRTIQ